MSIYHYDFDSEDHDAWFRVDIEYGHTKGELQRGRDGFPPYFSCGSLEVFEVRVKEFERYDSNGDVVEQWTRTVTVTDRERELDQLAYDKIVEEVEEWGSLAENMVKAA